MKLRIFAIMVVLTGCISCNESGRQAETPAGDTATDDTYIATTPIPLDGCYKMIFKDDTAILRLNVIDSFVTGELSYRLYAKDRNDGSLKGVIRDSVILADYTFRSEGTLSVRQVAFKLEGTSLIEGHGDINGGGDTVRFKDIKQLTFQHQRPYIKVPCIE
ncbi:MAG TPA: hypothetical protein VGD17_02150 [Chitinophagaceae bacterium]